MNYYNELEKALMILNSKIFAIEKAMTDEYDLDNNFAKILEVMYKTRREVERMLSAHKIIKASKETFLLSKSGEVELIYTVKNSENVSSIAKKHNTTVEKILTINNLTANEIQTGAKLKVVVPSKGLDLNYENIPTYTDDIEGDKIFGLDAQNDFTEDFSGDIKILTPTKTMTQALLNRLTTIKGDYPNEPEFGIDVDVLGVEIDNSLIQAMVTTRAINQLLLDPRVSEVKGINTKKESDAVHFNAVVETITGDNIQVGT